MTDITKIEAFIEGYPDWRGQQLTQLQQLILECNPDFNQEFKWGVPVFTLNKMVLAISAFTDHVKINFLQGAQLADPDHLFNSGLESKQHRSINLKKGQKIDQAALQRLIQAAIAIDQSRG